MATFSTSHTCHTWRISDFSTSVKWRHLKFLHMWRNFQFPHNCHKWKAEISPHDNVFSTNNISDISDKYQVCSKLTPCFPIRDSRILQFVEPRCRWSASATWSASEFESKLKVLLGGYLTIVLVVHHGTMEDTQTKCQGYRPRLVAAHRTI